VRLLQMTHGFDELGSNIDANGRVGGWWTAPSKANFDARAHCIETLCASRRHAHAAAR
jgi:predicted metalloendopeptidase